MIILQRIDGSDKSTLVREQNEETANLYGLDYRTFEKQENPVNDLKAIRDELTRLSSRKGAKSPADEILLYLDENALICPAVGNEALAVELLGDSFAAFSSDVGSENDRWNPGGVCASQALFKNTKEAGDFFDDWARETSDEQVRRNDRLTIQRALNTIFPKWSGQGARILYDYYRLAARQGHYVRQTYIDGAEKTKEAIANLRALLPIPDAEPVQTEQAEEEPTTEPEEKPKKTAPKRTSTKKKTKEPASDK